MTDVIQVVLIYPCFYLSTCFIEHEVQYKTYVLLSSEATSEGGKISPPTLKLRRASWPPASLRLEMKFRIGRNVFLFTCNNNQMRDYGKSKEEKSIFL